VPLGARYLAEGGVLLAMLGRDADRGRLSDVGGRVGLVLERLEAYELPVSKAARAVAVWRRG
jgi:16S rRNA (guanine527-N7)-methyltransferase